MGHGLVALLIDMSVSRACTSATKRKPGLFSILQMHATSPHIAVSYQVVSSPDKEKSYHPKETHSETLFHTLSTEFVPGRGRESVAK